MADRRQDSDRDLGSARELFRAYVDLAGPTGLIAEEVDPAGRAATAAGVPHLGLSRSPAPRRPRLTVVLVVGLARPGLQLDGALRHTESVDLEHLGDAFRDR